MIEFIGYQEDPNGEAFPLFNMLNEHHPLYGSTVLPETIVREGLLVPDHPTFAEWRQIQRAAMDLLEALKRLMEAEYPALLIMSPEDRNTAYQNAQEAINKAEGRVK